MSHGSMNQQIAYRNSGSNAFVHVLADSNSDMRMHLAVILRWVPARCHDAVTNLFIEAKGLSHGEIPVSDESYANIQQNYESIVRLLRQTQIPCKSAFTFVLVITFFGPLRRVIICGPLCRVFVLFSDH